MIGSYSNRKKSNFHSKKPIHFDHFYRQLIRVANNSFIQIETIELIDTNTRKRIVRTELVRDFTFVVYDKNPSRKRISQSVILFVKVLSCL